MLDRHGLNFCMELVVAIQAEAFDIINEKGGVF
jgi:hypothetical protein